MESASVASDISRKSETLSRPSMKIRRVVENCHMQLEDEKPPTRAHASKNIFALRSSASTRLSQRAGQTPEGGDSQLTQAGHDPLNRGLRLAVAGLTLQP